MKRQKLHFTLIIEIVLDTILYLPHATAGTTHGKYYVSSELVCENVNVKLSHIEKITNLNIKSCATPPLLIGVKLSTSFLHDISKYKVFHFIPKYEVFRGEDTKYVKYFKAYLNVLSVLR